MIEVKEAWIFPVNLLLILLFVIKCIAGYKKGLIRSALSFFMCIASFYLAWLISRVLGKYVEIVPIDFGILNETALAKATSQFVNGCCWFVILVIVIRILFYAIDFFFKSARKVSFLRGFDSIGGGLFGILEATVWSLIIK